MKGIILITLGLIIAGIGGFYIGSNVSDINKQDFYFCGSEMPNEYHFRGKSTIPTVLVSNQHKGDCDGANLFKIKVEKIK